MTISRAYRPNQWLENFITSYEFEATIEMFIDAIEDDSKDLQYQNVFFNPN
jgi:hypothetical protein